jgi:excisionase family DNA binding protein
MSVAKEDGNFGSGLLSVGSLSLVDQPPLLLSPEDVASACSLSRRAVYRAIERGELPAARLCSRLRIRFEDFESWLETNRVEPVTRVLPPRESSPLPASHGLRRLLG